MNRKPESAVLKIITRFKLSGLLESPHDRYGFELEFPTSMFALPIDIHFVPMSIS